jgi:hypothetical protein
MPLGHLAVLRDRVAMAAFAVVSYLRRAMKEGALLGLVGLNVLGLVFTYYATRGENTLSGWLVTGFNRMALHFAPLLLFCCGLCFDGDLTTWLGRASTAAHIARGWVVRPGSE